MFKKQILLSVLISIFLMSGCTEESPLISDVDLVVVWAYLYAGEPVTNIKITSTIPLDTDSSGAPPINNAVVSLIKDGELYECIPSPGDSGYYHYPDTSMPISAGDNFTIEVEYNDDIITAQTIVPEKPINVSISSTEMSIPDFNDMQALREWQMGGGSEPIQITWDSEEDSWYYVMLENIDSNPIELNSWMHERMKDFIFPPINDNTHNIRLPYITHLGRHRITVYKVNQEYVDLYESRDQDSRDLNEPLTNIENGLGVFTAFNSASTYLKVVQMQ